MWSFKKSEKVWTCPDSSLVQIARIQASDKDDAFKDLIVNNEIAKEYLEKQGFEVNHIDDPEPITEVPKVANWNDRQHRELYEKLERKPDNELTEEERRFCITMYHMEEYACGLDGDR